MKGILVAVLLCAILLPAFSQGISAIDVSTEAWADCTETDGSGLYFDIIRMVYAEQNPKLSIKYMPFARSVQLLEAAKTDLSIGNYIGDVTNGLYPRFPIDYDDLTVMMPSAMAAGFSGEASLKGRKVAWIVDYGYEQYLDVPVVLTEVSDIQSGIKMLQSGRVDYYIDTKSSIEPSLEEMGISGGDFGLKTLKWIRLYVCFVKNAKGSQLQAIWDKRMPVLMKSGELKKAFETWGFEDSYAKLDAEF